VTAVLSWADTPHDLDLHMSGPDGSGGRFHAYFSAKNPVPHVFLDLDDTSSRGPETMTIRPGAGDAFIPGEYRIWVHNFSGSPEFDASEARIILTAGGAQLAQYDVDVASGDPALGIWQVVNITVDTDGGVSAVSVVQTFAEGSSASVF